MRLILNLPRPSYQGAEALGGCLLRAQARDPIDHFHPFLACFGEHDVTPKLKNLGQPGPITVAYESLTRREIALLDAPMAQVDSPCRGLVVANRRERKDQLDISPQLRLGLFYAHEIIPPLFYTLLT